MGNLFTVTIEPMQPGMQRTHNCIGYSYGLGFAARVAAGYGFRLIDREVERIGCGGEAP
ncbi:hypothetical protein [Sphingomonas baiyangensis]|uniref:hypothetical protein n=1 Tax=Sphingomonas baiyangensis TaxID=2572576 RepID=UPI00146EA700|nr:hypothetical protein [Sphingomonas baiyangensis]